MDMLKDRILRDGQVREGSILSVDSFLNHQIDINLYNEIGRELRRRFAGVDFTKILTIEASGIGLACIAALHFGDIPVVFAKKNKTLNISGDVYSADVFSYTSKKTYTITVSQKYIGKGDRILIIDDFLATGTALMGLTDIVEQAGAVTAGIGIVIEKGFQDGGSKIRSKGLRLESLAIIDRIDGNRVVFR